METRVQVAQFGDSTLSAAAGRGPYVDFVEIRGTTGFSVCDGGVRLRRNLSDYTSALHAKATCEHAEAELHLEVSEPTLNDNRFTPHLSGGGRLDLAPGTTASTDLRGRCADGWRCEGRVFALLTLNF